MTVLLGSKSLSDEKMESNNSKNNYKLVFSFLFLIFIYMYLFTQIYQYIGITSPEDLFKSLGAVQKLVLFDDDGNLDSNIEINRTKNINFNNDDERLAFFGILSLTFLASYFLKVKYKRISIIIGTILIFFLTFDWHQILIFLSMHLILYLLFHNKNIQSKYLSFLPGFMLFFALIINKLADIRISQIIFAILSGIFFSIYYNVLIIKLLENKKIAHILRTIFIQLTMISIFIIIIINLISGYVWSIPAGLYLFFIQWQRLILYQIDYKDDLIPLDISLINYGIVFFNPATVTNCVDGHNIGAGYRYITSNYLVEDKNKILLSGLKILTIALFYLVLYSWFSVFIKNILQYILGVPIFVSLDDLIEAQLKGIHLYTSTVLFSTIMYQTKWFFLFGGIVHFKVGIWRAFGFRVDPYFNKPWLATNLISLWARYSFYYREFLVKAFYYPVFFNFFKKNKKTRIFVATLASSFLANYTWGHMPELLMVRGVEAKNLVYVLPRWPYFLLLGLGISLTQIYFLNKKTTRKAWTKDRRFILDIFCAYLTIQFFSLIHIFARPNPDASLWDYTKIFLIGCGIYL